jgi:hypothetical protein
MSWLLGYDILLKTFVHFKKPIQRLSPCKE